MASPAQLNLTGNRQITYTINENPIIEPLDGPTAIGDILDRYFPDTLYQTGKDTRLYKLLTSLAGDSGAGYLKKLTLSARLKNEGPLLVFHDLDTFYAHIFRFPRLKSEIYDYDPNNMSLEKQVWDKILSADRAYHKRVIDFFHATRFGNSPYGIALAARSGAGQDVDVIENYRYIFDQYSDLPLDLAHEGNSLSTSEFILQPRIITNPNGQALSLTIKVIGFPTAGTFRISYDNVLSTPIPYNGDATLIQATINNIGGTGDAAILVDGDVSVTQVANKTYLIKLNNKQLSPFLFTIKTDSSFDATGARVEVDYPLKDTFYVSKFFGPSMDWYEDNLAAINNGTFNDVDPNSRVGNFKEKTTIYLDPGIEKNMVETVDHLRPVGALATVKSTTERLIDVPASKVFASSENFHVSRFVTGNPNVSWPITDPTLAHFIQGNILSSEPGSDGTQQVVEVGVENEATFWAFAGKAIPVIFHTIDSVFAYRDEALNDVQYGTPNFYVDAYDFYRSEHNGIFSQSITLTWYQFLKSIQPSDVFPAILAIADQNTPLVMDSPVI